VPKSHLLVPLRLADGQERRPGAVGMAEDGDVDLMQCLVLLADLAAIYA
jgi:hypothetical protein